jgi:hypothetical protein
VIENPAIICDAKPFTKAAGFLGPGRNSGPEFFGVRSFALLYFRAGLRYFLVWPKNIFADHKTRSILGFGWCASRHRGRALSEDYASCN